MQKPMVLFLDVNGPGIRHEYDMGRKVIMGFIAKGLSDDYSAWLVKPGDVESLKQGLKILIDDEHRRSRLGKATRQEVVAKYTWKEHTRKIIDKLKERCE
jgi:glycosyltransferase involved in cell wall biosynthesis